MHRFERYYQNKKLFTQKSNELAQLQTPKAGSTKTVLPKVFSK